MNLTGAIVLYAITWFMTFYVVLQMRTKTQQEIGEVVPGTPASAPAFENIGTSVKIASIIATILWVTMAVVITSGWITLEMIDIFGFMR